MRSRKIRKSKVKNRRAGVEQVKAKLPRNRTKIEVVRDKRSSLKCSKVSLSRIRKTVASREVGLPTMSGSVQGGQLGLQRSLKAKKKKVYKSENANEKAKREAKHSMDISFEARDSSKESDDDDQKRKTQNKKRSLGSPVIIEALSECQSSPGTPEAFRQRESSNEDGHAYSIFPIENAAMTDEVNASVVVGRLFDPNETPRTSHRHRAQKSPGSKKHESWRRSDKEDQTSPEVESCTPRKGKASRWTHEENAPRLYSIRNTVVGVMQARTRFCFAGKLKVKVAYGAVEVYGTLLTSSDSPIEVYSPRGYSSVAIESSEKSASHIEPNVWPLLYGEGIKRATEGPLVTDIDNLRPGMAVVLLTNLENKLTKFLHVFYPFKLFPWISNNSYFSWTDPRRAEVVLQSNLYFGNNGHRELVVDPTIVHSVSTSMLNRWRANEWACTLIAGGKGVGKSTAMRYLINGTLPDSRMVVLVDVDPGQTECTPAECISYSLIEQPLTGANFTHLKTPVYQLYIGDVNVARCLPRYIEGIRMLVEKLKSCPVLSRLPIVVNTMGFTDGIGWDIALYIIKLIRPSTVVQITSQKAKNNFKSPLSTDVVNQEKAGERATWIAKYVDGVQEPCVHELRVIPSQAERKKVHGSDSWNMEPYQQRELVMISYLSQIVQCPESLMSYYSALSFSINHAVPYVTPFSSLSISIPRASSAPSHALGVINGNIVALCGYELTCESYGGKGPRVLTRSPLCVCYGFGIVRGIDMEREEVYINSPLPGTTMQHVNCLVGCVPVPVTLLQFNRQANAPYTGGNDLLPTSREHRRGYFRMRYPANS